MGYRHIDNLYKNQEILNLEECFALEKIHGTSAHVSIKLVQGKPEVKFFSGGSKYETFLENFNAEQLKTTFSESELTNVIIYGESYGGKCQGMSATYGKVLKFVAFEVKIDDVWLNVPDAEAMVEKFGLEFVAYERIKTDLKSIDAERDRPSRQAKRNGIEEDKIAEGVVLRPIIETRNYRGNRILCKHKRDEFMETKTPRKVDPEKQKILENARDIAIEWVTPMRLEHVLDKIENISMENMREIIGRMVEDVKREGEGEIVWSKQVASAIGKTTAQLVKQRFQKELQNGK